MKSSTRQLLRAITALSVAAPATVFALTPTWDGNGSANTGGTFSTAVNWDNDLAPGSADTAIFGDVTSGTRTVVYDSAASATVTALTFNQTTAGAFNILDIQRSFTVTNAIVLGTGGSGTERISFNTGNTPTGGATLTATGGITLNAGGELQLASFRQAATSTLFQSDISGSVTVSGGTLTVRATDNNAAGNTATSASNTISTNLTMSSGALVIDNATGLADRRLSVNGNLNVTGGTISTTLVGANGTLFLSGGTNVLNATSYDTDLSLTLGGGGSQSLSTTNNLGAITLRGTGVKTLTSSGTVGQIFMIDGNGAIADSATTLRLGSNLTLASGAGQLQAATFSQTTDTTTPNRTNFTVDTNGFTLDLSTGASSGVWTPNIGATGNLPVWNISGTGKIKANAFNLSTANVTTNIASGTTLEAVGGNSTASNLGGTGTIDPNSTFRYAGTAAAGTPATLTSNRNLGDIEVASGALRMLTGSTGTVQDLRVTGGTFDLDANTTRTFATISLDGGTLANGTFATAEANYTGLSTGTVSGKLTGAKELRKTTAGTLTISNSGNDYSGATIVSAGTLALGNANALGLTPNLQITGGTLDLGGFTINKFVQSLTNGGTISNGTINRTSATTFFLSSGTISANLTDSGAGVLGLTKNTTGTVTISGVNSYDGVTSVTAGTLLINGNNSGATGAVTVSSGATLGGSGTIGGATTINAGGFLAAGNSPGILSFTNTLTLNGTTTFETLGGGLVRGVDFDGINTGAGLLTYGGALSMSFTGTYADGTTLNFFDIGAGGQTGNFASVSVTGVYSGSLTYDGIGAWTGIFGAQQLSYSNATGDLSFTTAIPEPSAFAALAGLAVIGAVALRRRRRA